MPKEPKPTTEEVTLPGKPEAPSKPTVSLEDLKKESDKDYDRLEKGTKL